MADKLPPTLLPPAQIPQPDLDAMICALPCDFCGKPGARCVFVSGPRAGRLYLYPHAKRHRAAVAAGIIDEFRRLLDEWSRSAGSGA